MVCKSCEKKLGKVAAADPFRNRNAQGTVVSSGLGGASSSKSSGPAMASSGSSIGGGREVGKNKLLGSKNRYSPTATRCTLCKGQVQQDRAKYCQQCAFKRGMCSICGKAVLDANVKKMSRMSST